MTTEQASAQAYLADARNDKVLVYVCLLYTSDAADE